MEPVSHQENSKAIKMGKVLLIVNCVILAIGNCGGPLIMRLYFVNGGKRVWLSSVLQTAGFPIVLIPLVFLAIRRHRRCRTEPSEAWELFQLRPPLMATAAAVGVLTGLDDYLYAYGMARLPVSTSSLIIASQLGFTAAFAYLLVRQRLTPFSLNAVVLLTVGAAVLALHTSGDRPAGETKGEYAAGFGMTVGAAALYGFILPLVELTYKRAKQEVSYTVVLEYQFVMCLFASAFCFIGMIINNDFQAIPREALEFKLSETKYYVIMVMSAVIWQGFFLGAIGVVFCFSSLFSGIIIAVLLPVTEVLAVIFFRESFKAEKGVSLVLSLWGFVSYFYGEIKRGNKEVKDVNVEEEIQKPVEIEITQRDQIV